MLYYQTIYICNISPIFISINYIRNGVYEKKHDAYVF